jgi:metallo-beta-lactamase family protein
MSLQLQFCGATGEVTGSLYVVRTPAHTVLLECGLLQGGVENEQRNRDPFPFEIGDVDAVILSHAHIDHSGRLPRLVRQGYEGPVYAQTATKALCGIMLPDSGYLNEKDAEWENRKRRDRGEPPVEPLYTREDGEACIGHILPVQYGEPVEVVSGLMLTFHDAGHILGSAVVELVCRDGGRQHTLVFSGDLGFRDAPVMKPATRLTYADAVLMESTYGDRLHRPIAETLEELGEVFATARTAQGNILIPAFTVGRTQDLLYLMGANYDRWHLDDWHIFLDSPMGIEATGIYSQFSQLCDVDLSRSGSPLAGMRNFHQTRTPEESMVINSIESGAIIIAGSGMCSGGRILHHLKHNVWRPQCHLVIVGYQAIGTLGRRLVDGAQTIRLWGDEYRVRLRVHTIGGLSAHADQSDLVDWYRSFTNRPRLYLVHGEPAAQRVLAGKLQSELAAPVEIPQYLQTITVPARA